MFRPTHFVILFAVFLCAYAAPASEPIPAVEAPSRVLEPPFLKESNLGAEGAGAQTKGDLDTDATAYLRFSYGPKVAYYGPGLSARAYGWGFRKSIGFGPYISVW